MDELWPTNRLGNGDQEVVGVSIHGRKRLQKDVPIRGHPQRPRLVVRAEQHLRPEVFSAELVFLVLGGRPFHVHGGRGRYPILVIKNDNQ